MRNVSDMSGSAPIAYIPKRQSRQKPQAPLRQRRLLWLLPPVHLLLPCLRPY